MDSLVSIICPIRNEENYISLCLDSILDQTIQQDRIEIIVVDGMSVDRTRNILSSYSARFTNIKLVDNERLRVTNGFNLGLKNAMGDVIIRVDGHAKLAPSYIKNCLIYLKKAGADCVGGVIESINDTKCGKAIALAMSSKFGVGNSCFRTSQKEGYVDTVAFGAYKRDVFDKIGILDEELIGADDDEFNYRLRHSGGRIYMTPEIKATYYTRSGFKKLWKQYFGYGFWKVRVMQKHLKLMQPRQFIPSIFILSLICTSVSGIYSNLLFYLLLSMLLCYIVLSFIAVIKMPLKNSAGLYSRIFFSFLILHFSYGIGFLWGQIRFFPRWFGNVQNKYTDEYSEKKYRVLQLRSSIGFYGAENMILELCNQLNANIYIPYIGVIKNFNPNSTKLADKASQFSLPNIIFSSERYISIKIIYELNEFIKKENIDILHSHGYKANFYASAIKLIRRIPCVATCHPWDETEYSFKARVYTFFDKMWLTIFDHLIPVSRNVENELPNIINQNKVTLIPNGVDGDRFCHDTHYSLRKELNLDPDIKIIGAVGRLVPEKGYIYLIKAIQKLVDYNSRIIVVIVGDGPLKNELIDMVHKYRLDKHIVFLGVRDDIPAILDSIDIFVLSSISEGLPMVVLEAMAAGIPIIATSVGDVPTVLRHEREGLLVYPKDVNQLYLNLRELLDNEKLAIQIGISAKIHLKQKYSSAQMAENYISIYKKLLESQN